MIRLGALLLTAFLSLGCMSAAAQIVGLDIADENAVLRFSVASYMFAGTKLGERPPPGTRFLIVRGTLENKNLEKGVDVPNAADAFPLLINGSVSIPLDPLSADTADAYWGPQVLHPGEARPIEFVYVVPAEGVERAEIRHLSNAGRISLYVVGEAEPGRENFEFGPVELGFARLAVGNVQRSSSFNGAPAKRGHQFVLVEYWYTNLREMAPLETNIASLSALEVDGGYMFQSLTLPASGQPLPVEVYHAGEATMGQMVFEVPQQIQDLVLVHYTEEGALRLPLSTDFTPREPRQAIAGPTRDGSIEVTVYAQQLTADGLILDVGLRLNHPDGMADMPIDLSTGFELHRSDGSFANASPLFPGIRRPVTYVVLRRDQLNLGQIGFPGVGPGSHTLLLPLASGRVSLRLPPLSGGLASAPRPAPVAAQAAPSQTGSPASMLPNFGALIPGSATAPAAPAQPSAAQPASTGGVAAATPPTTTRAQPPAPAPPPKPRDLSKLRGIPQVIDTATLTIRFDTVLLYGIQGEGEPYRSQLEAFIADREVECVKQGAAYRCILGGEDVSVVAARNGAARATDDAPASVRDAQAQAKAGSKGIWR